MALINFLKGANEGSTLELVGDKIILGRSQECSIVLNVPAVSREHAVIRRIAGKFYIEDLKSRNKTFVNNKEITTRTLLKDNDKIKICDNILAFFESSPKAPLPDDLKRTVQAVIEQNHDKDGIIWPPSIAPYMVHIALLDPDQEESRRVAEELYASLNVQGIDCLLDDRPERPGVKFKDADLLGMPLRVNIGARGLAAGELELVERKTKNMQKVHPGALLERIQIWLKENAK